ARSSQFCLCSAQARLGSNQVCNFRCAFGMKPVHGILDYTISIRNTFVLAQVLKPGINEKGLYHPSFDCSILEYGPGICAIAATFLTKLFKRCEEWFAFPWINTIFNRDQNRSSILLDLLSDDRCWPMHRGCKITFSARLEHPSPGEGHHDQGPYRGREMRSGKAHERSN